MRFLWLMVFVLAGKATVLDRLAVSVGPQVITEQQVEEELRVTALINHEKIMLTDDERRAAADHLIEQLLVKREMELSHYPLPDEQDLEKYLAEVRAGFGSGESFAAALANYDLTEVTLKEHLSLQLAMLRFVEFRFRADVDSSDSDVKASYEREVAAWRANHPGVTPPSFSSSRDAIRKALLEQRTDQVLTSWLEETRKQVSIVYLDKSLR